MEIRLSQAYSFSQLGHRSNQEDSRLPDCDTPPTGQRFFAVCDGVGGNEKGEVASRTVCNSMATALASHDWQQPFTINDFQRALDFVYSEIARISTDDNRGMATTMTFAAFHRDGCFIAHIGDSRVYYVRPGEGIIYRTDDHSLVNALVRAGVITEEEAETHPDRNVITRCITLPDAKHPRSEATTVNITDVRAGDYVFLCSDGVLKRLSDTTLVSILESGESDAAKCARIASLSLDSDDNNTASLVRVADVTGANPTVEAAAVTNAETHAGKRRSKVLLAIIAVALIALTVVAALFFLTDRNRDIDDARTTTEKVNVKKATPAKRKGDLKKFLSQNLKYPDSATGEGVVVLQLTVNSKGEVKDAKVIRPLEKPLDEEAVRLALQFRYSPALDADGRPVDCEVTERIRFSRPQKPTAAPTQPRKPQSAQDGAPVEEEQQQNKPVEEVQPEQPDNSLDGYQQVSI